MPTPQIQHGSYKAPAQKSYSYTETKPTANTGTAVKANTAAYNPYATKDRVENGQNGYSVLPKLQAVSNYTNIQRQSAIDELWAKYGARLMGKNDKEQPQKPAKITEPQSPKVQTVKAGRSTINIRDDGSTIHYESDTAIDLFDFLDFLSGRYGPNNEMAESVKIDDKAQNRTVGTEFTSADSETVKEEFYRNRLSEVNWQIVDIAAKDEPLTDKDMDKLTALYEEQDYLHKQLKIDLYDEDLSLTDRLMLAGQGEAYNRVYGPGTVLSLSGQAFKEYINKRIMKHCNNFTV